MLALTDGFAGVVDRAAWISRDRILARLDQDCGGVTELLYHGPQPQAGNTYLLRGASALTWGVELSDGPAWRAVPHRYMNVQLHPHACETSWSDGVVTVRTRVELFDNALLIILNARNDSPSPIQARFQILLDADGLAAQVHGTRAWQGPVYFAGDCQLRMTAHDRLHTLDWINVPGFTDAHLDTRVHGWLGSTTAATYRNDDRRHGLTTLPVQVQPGESLPPPAFVWVCGGDEEEMTRRMARLTTHCQAQSPDPRLPDPRAALSNPLEAPSSGRLPHQQAPRLSLPDRPWLGTAFSLTPGYVDAAKVEGTGSIRASAGGDYFVWGWDSLISGHEFYRWGDVLAMQQMVDFFETHRAADGSIPHRYDNNLEVLQATGYDFNAQLFISLVYHTFVQTGNLDWLAQHYPTARELFLVMAGQTDDRGMFACLGMYPDAPEKLGRAPDHFIAEEQGFWYSVCRMMARLAMRLHDDSLAQQANEISARVHQHFLPVFYDASTGFITDSVDSQGRRNATFPLWALMVTHTADGIDLVSPRWPELADYIERRLMGRHGINMVPDDDPHYGTETVTSSCWFMHFDVYALRVLRRAGRTASILRWLNLAEHAFQEYLAVPELLHTAPQFIFNGRHVRAGQRWQMFGAAGWYRGLVEGVAGVECDIGGLTLVPADLPLDIDLTGHHFGQSIWDIHITGRGGWWDRIVVDDRQVAGSYKLPADLLAPGRHTLTIRRTATAPALPVLLSATGAMVRRCGYADGVLQVDVWGHGPATARFWSAGAMNIAWENRPIATSPGGATSVELNLAGSGLLTAGS